MEIFSRLGRFADDRLLFNIIALHAALGGMLLLSMLLRWLIGRCMGHLAHATGWQNLDQLSRRLRTGLFWTTIGLMVLIVVGSVGYHLAGRHIRHDIRGWLARLTWTEIWNFSLAALELGGVVLIARLAR